MTIDRLEIIKLDTKKHLELTFDLHSWKEGLLSTSEVLTRIVTADAHPDVVLLHICEVIVELRKKEEAEAELLAKYDGCPNDYRPNS